MIPRERLFVDWRYFSSSLAKEYAKQVNLRNLLSILIEEHRSHS